MDIGRGYRRIRIADLRPNPIRTTDIRHFLKSARFAADYADNPPYSGGLDTLNSRPGFPGFNFCRKNVSIWTSLDSTKDSEGLMLVQLVVIATNQIMKFKNLMWWAIFLKRKLKKKSLVVEYLNLLKPVVSVLRQSAGFF